MSGASRRYERGRTDTGLAIACGLAFALGLLCSQPRLGVRSADAVAYVLGSYSLQNGTGFGDLAGGSLRQFPPGYSLLLSTAPDPVNAALLVNYAALGLAVGCLFLLARAADWSRLAALGLATALGAGFWRILATSAAPDILTYAAFLVGLSLYRSARPWLRGLSYAVWIVLIPFKLVALAFAPAAVLADLLEARSSRVAAPWRTAILVGLGWTAALGGHILFRLSSGGSLVPPGPVVRSIPPLLEHVTAFASSIPRSLIAAWYGSIKEPVGLLMFGLMLVAGVAAIVTLRPIRTERWVRWFGLAVLGLSFCLLPVREFETAARLMAYGVLALVLSCRPWSDRGAIWAGYGLVSLLVGLANLATVNSLGVNDPRYQALAHQVIASGLGAGPLFTNGYYLTDLHERRASRVIAGLDDLAVAPPGASFLRITLPSYDAVAAAVTPMGSPGPGWSPVWEIEGATLYRKDE